MLNVSSSPYTRTTTTSVSVLKPNQTQPNLDCMGCHCRWAVVVIQTSL